MREYSEYRPEVEPLAVVLRRVGNQVVDQQESVVIDQTPHGLSFLSQGVPDRPRYVFSVESNSATVRIIDSWFKSGESLGTVVITGRLDRMISTNASIQWQGEIQAWTLLPAGRQ